MQHWAYYYRVTATTSELWRLHEAGKLNPVQEAFFQRKAPEELYDMEADPHEVRNLAADPRHEALLEKMRAEQVRWSVEVRDLGFIPEGELQRLAQGKSYYEVTRDEAAYPVRRVVEAAQVASLGNKKSLSRLRESMDDGNGIVRYWGATGALILGQEGRAVKPQLRKLLVDAVPDVRIVAAEALCAMDECAEALPVLAQNLEQGWVGARLAAANVLDRLDERARPVAERVLSAYAIETGRCAELEGKTKVSSEPWYRREIDLPWLYAQDSMKSFDYLDSSRMARVLDKALSDLRVEHVREGCL